MFSECQYMKHEAPGLHVLTFTVHCKYYEYEYSVNDRNGNRHSLLVSRKLKLYALLILVILYKLTRNTGSSDCSLTYLQVFKCQVLHVSECE